MPAAVRSCGRGRYGRPSKLRSALVVSLLEEKELGIGDRADLSLPTPGSQSISSNPLGTAGPPSYLEFVFLAGRFGRLLQVLLLSLVLVAAAALPAGATFYPTSIRLALLFDRVQWQSQVETLTPLPRRHIAERWER